MALRQEIAEKDGDAVSLSTILRTACLLLTQNDKKTLSAREVQFAVSIHFGGDKKKFAIREATKKLTRFTSYSDENMPEEFASFPPALKHIKRLIGDFSVRKIGKGSIAYLMGIFDNLQNYQMEDITYYPTVDIKFFLKCVDNIASNEKKLTVKSAHFMNAKQILNPEGVSIEWSIDRTPDNVKEELPGRKVDNSFFSLIIYKFQTNWFSRKTAPNLFGDNFYQISCHFLPTHMHQRQMTP